LSVTQNSTYTEEAHTTTSSELVNTSQKKKLQTAKNATTKLYSKSVNGRKWLNAQIVYMRKTANIKEGVKRQDSKSKFVNSLRRNHD